MPVVSRPIAVVALLICSLCSALAEGETIAAQREAEWNRLLVCIYPVLLRELPFGFSPSSTRATVVQVCDNQIRNINRLFPNENGLREGGRVSLDDTSPPLLPSDGFPSKVIVNDAMKTYSDALRTLTQH